MGTEQSLDDKVRSWLHGQGYPLEFAAARILRSEGLQVFQGQTYEEGDRVRETDVVARVPDTRAHCELVVECKSSPHPWIALTATASPARTIREAWLISGGDVQGWLDSEPTRWTYNVPDPYGFSLVQAFRKSGDADSGYAALSAAVDAAIGMRERFSVASRPEGVFLPVFVIDAPLFRFGVLADGEEELQRVPLQRMLWNGSAKRKQMTVVDVVTLDQLPVYASGMAAHLDALAKHLTP